MIDTSREAIAMFKHEDMTHWTDAHSKACIAALEADLAQPVQPAVKSIQNVILWLEGGCDPKAAAQELRILIASTKETTHG